MSFLTNNYDFHRGVGVSGEGFSIPLQTIPKTKKTPEWEKSTMDALEMIGLNQLYKNLEFRDYYAMTEGRLVHRDFLQNPEDFEQLREVGQLMNQVRLPTYVKHYDLLGMIVNQLTGELMNMRDSIRMTSDDNYAKNDYIREKEQMISKYVQESFTNHLNRLLALKGINPVKDDFESEEEKQQYLQFLEQEKAKIKSPKEIDTELTKSWKLRAVEWAESTYEHDITRFGMEKMEEDEMKDYLLTGRFFTHYHIGYDFYKPERWDPIQTFFSEELDIKNPQDGEYVGKIDFMSASKIIQKYGSKLSKSVQIQLSKEHSARNSTDFHGKSNSVYARPVAGAYVPDENYFERELLTQYQDAFNTPLGETIVTNEDGSQTKVPTWLSNYNNSNSYATSNIAKELRKDINVRGDLFRVTEAYWRGSKLHYAIRYESENGYVVEDLVSEDLINEFIKENNIKKLSSITLEEFDEDEKGEYVNVICQVYLPAVYRGKKISAGAKTEDIYFDIKEMEFQIKGDSNLFDVKLPVAGIIGNSLAQKIRPYQLGYNICLNQITNLLEKELGMFFIMDMNLLPSEFKEEGDAATALGTLRDTIKDTGFLPVDMRKQNTQEPGNTTNTFVKQEISFDQQISRRITLAEYYKKLAFEQIGITEQRKGSPNEYQTNEGIKVGQEASYAQTKSIYTDFNHALQRKVELHLTVAQYCVKNEKDISSFYTNSDGDTIFNKFSDDNFHLRKLGVLPSSDSKGKKEMENLKRFLYENNTMGNDVLAFAEISRSDNFMSIIEFGKKERERLERLEQEKRQFESDQLDKTLAAQKEEKQIDRAFEKLLEDNRNRTKLMDSEIDALGRASDKKSDATGIAAIKAATDASLKEQDIESRNQVENRKLDLKEKETTESISLKARQLENEIRALNLKEKEINSKNFQSIINKN